MTSIRMTHVYVAWTKVAYHNKIQLHLLTGFTGEWEYSSMSTGTGKCYAIQF